MRSITFKLLLAFLVVSLVSVLLIVLSARWVTDREFRNFFFNQNRNNIVSALADYYSKNGTWDGIENALLVPRTGAPPRGVEGGSRFFTLVDASNKVILAGPGDQVGDMLPASDVKSGIPIKVSGKTVGTLVTRQPTIRANPAETAFLDRLIQIYSLSAIAVTALAVLLAFLLSRSLTRPIRELTTATRAMSEGQLEQVVPVRSHDELGELALSFNKMNAELARSADVRRQMTADIAHELRTPVSVILGHAEAVHDGVLAPSVETFEIIRDEAERLEKLIEDLRTLSRADAGELPIERQPVAPAKLLEKVQAISKQRADEKQIEIVVDAKSDLPEISADPGRMMQVLSNLVDNALRYTPRQGCISLCGQAVDGNLEIRVHDSGPGVASDELSRIFDRFYRSDPSRQRDEGGSGLGLAIAKSIVEKHDGRIWAESEKGSGTTIVIQLPIPQSPAVRKKSKAK
ncbi:MAG TPA: ATP-binding protein [Anaerolineales bacterium]|nr:ATP-binding protein [Anaerolineales bacterium]